MIHKLKNWMEKQKDILNIMDDLDDWFMRLPLSVRLDIFNKYSLGDNDEVLARYYQK